MIIQVTEAREWAEEFKNQLEQARREHRQARDEWQHDRRQLEAELADRAKQLAQREKQYQHAVSDFQRQLQQTAADAARWREAAERIHADLKENRIPAASSAQASGRNIAAAPVPQASSASLVAVPPSHSGASADPEDSIESFVERLLRRVRGPTLRDAGAEDDGERGGESTQLTDDELVPHTLAPELATDLAAMREVANESARAAIRASVRRRSTHEALTKMMSAGLAIGSGVVLINAASHAKSAYPVAGACFVAGVYWATRSVLYIRYLIGSRRKSQRAFSATPEPTQD